jgi:hypothetical protein
MSLIGPNKPTKDVKGDPQSPEPMDIVTPNTDINESKQALAVLQEYTNGVGVLLSSPEGRMLLTNSSELNNLAISLQQILSVIEECKNEQLRLSVIKSKVRINNKPIGKLRIMVSRDDKTFILPTKLTDFDGVCSIWLMGEESFDKIESNQVKAIDNCEIYVGTNPDNVPVSLTFWSGGSYHLRYGGTSVSLCKYLERVIRLEIKQK